MSRSFTRAAVTLCALILGTLTVLALDWSTALSLIGGGLLVCLGAMWPVLWVASIMAKRRESASERPDCATMPSAPAGQSASRVRLSVLIPARNEASVIGRMVSQLRAQSYPDFEAIIVANNCSDATAAVARWVAASDPRFHVLEATFPDGVKADALNFALARATGDAIVQLDADNAVQPDFLGSVAAAFRDPDAQALQTAIRALNADEGLLPHLQDIEFQVYSEVFNAGRVALGRSSSIGGTGFAIRTPVIRSLGGWSRHLVEDFELHLRLARAGIEVRYLGSVAVWDEKPATWGALINQRRRWIRGHVALALSPRSAKGLPLMEKVYLYSPLGIALSVVLLSLGYVASLVPGLVPPFAYLSPAFWLASIVASAAMLFFVTRARGRRLRVFTLLTYLFVFGFHWVLVLFAALLPASWAKTKTVHGQGTRPGISGYLGVDGVRSASLLIGTALLACLWLTPLFAAIASPDGAYLLAPIQAPLGSTVAVTSVIERAEAAGTASLGGTVVSSATGKPISGAALTLTSGKLKYTRTSSSLGTFSFTVSKPGTYAFTATKSGYVKGSCRVTLGSGESVKVLVMLSSQHAGIIYIVPTPY